MFERLCEPHRHERAFGRRKRLALRRANRKLDRWLGEISVGAHARDRRLEARGVSSECGCARGDLSLKHTACERRRQSALPFDLLKQPPGFFANRLCQRLERPSAGGGVGDKSKVGFAQEDDLGIAGETPREAVRKAGRERVRQNADAVGARRDRPRTPLPRRASHSRKGRAPSSCARRFPPAHEPRAARGRRLPRRATRRCATRLEFRQCRQFVRIGGKPERDEGAGFPERRPDLFKQTIGSMRLRAQRRAPAPGCRQPHGRQRASATRNGPGKTFASQRQRGLRTAPRLSRSSRLETVRGPKPRKGRDRTLPRNPRALRPSARSQR